MKKALLLTASLVLAACSEGGPTVTGGGGTGGTAGHGDCPALGGAESCNADEVGLKRCIGEELERCDGCYWIAQEDCAASRSGWVCIDLLAGVAHCGEDTSVPVRGKSAECGIDVATCEPGLTCSSLADGSSCLCLVPCAANPSICDAATEFCNTRDFTEGACTPLGGVLDACTNESDCLPGLSCLTPTGSTGATCVQKCDTDPNACTADEKCDATNRYPIPVCLPRLAEGDVCAPADFNCARGLLCLTITNRGTTCSHVCQDHPENCTADQYCADTSSIPVCLPRVGEFDLCSGNDCDAALTCSGRTSGGDVCVRACENAPTLCVPGEYCDTSGVFVESACLPVVREGDACGDGLAQCGANLGCVTGPAGAVCLRVCETDPDICSANELCDKSGTFSQGACIPVVSEWQACGSGVAKCAFGLTCSNGPDGQVCVRRCVDNPSICVSGEICDTTGTYSESACVPVVGELEACGGGLASCFLGLTCSAAPGNDNLCAGGCSADPTVCDPATEYCDTRLVSAGTCFATGGARDALCASQGGCDPAYVCMSTGAGNMTCKLPCSGAEVGTPSNCPDGETCLASGGIERQPGGGINGISCNPVDVPTTCDSANKYECTESVNPISGATTHICTRPTGLCGVEAALLTSLTRNDLGNLPPENSCDQASQNVFCPTLDPAVTATVECTDTHFANPITVNSSTFPCSDSSDCLIVGGEMIADAECGHFSEPTGSVCASFSKACVAFCEGADGNDLTCPAGLACQVPLPPNEGPGFSIFQGGGINCNAQGCFNGTSCSTAAQCSDGAGCIQGLCLTHCADALDCATDFHCEEPFLDLGPICTRTPKVCMNPQQAQQCR